MAPTNDTSRASKPKLLWLTVLTPNRGVSTGPAMNAPTMPTIGYAAPSLRQRTKLPGAPAFNPLPCLDIHPDPDESAASSSSNASSRSPQAFSHSVGHLALADKSIGPGRERGLLAGI